MEKQKKVVDASVIVKWFVQEQFSDKIVDLMEKHSKGEVLLMAPELLFVEVLNALKYKKVSGNFLAAANKTLWNAQFKIAPLNESLLQKTLAISLKEGLTIYDSLYVAIAEVENCQMITADKELYKIPNVVSLEKV